MGVISLAFTVYRLLFTVDGLGKATAKYVDWPCYEIRIENLGNF